MMEVASQVGYESEFAFAKAFKRITGTAPGAYRRSKGGIASS
jgi:AraC-like DNA-binding protein